MNVCMPAQYIRRSCHVYVAGTGAHANQRPYAHALLACLPATRGAFARYTRDCETTQRPISTSFNRRQLPAVPVTASDVFAVASSLGFVLVDSRGRTRSASGRDQREIGARVRAWVRAVVTGLSRRSTYFALCLFFSSFFLSPGSAPPFFRSVCHFRVIRRRFHLSECGGRAIPRALFRRIAAVRVLYYLCETTIARRGGIGSRSRLERNTWSRKKETLHSGAAGPTPHCALARFNIFRLPHDWVRSRLRVSAEPTMRCAAFRLI